MFVIYCSQAKHWPERNVCSLDVECALLEGAGGFPPSIAVPHDVLVGAGALVGDCDLVGFLLNDGGLHPDRVRAVTTRLVVGRTAKLETVQL